MEHLVKVKGLYTYPSEITEMPEGALKEALNVVINRDSVVETRPGFKNYGQLSANVNDRGKTLLIYKNTLIEHYGSTMQYDVAGTPTLYSGTYTAPTHGDSYVPRIRGQEMNSNFYFTSNTGIQKLASLSSTIVTAGAPQGLDLNLTLTGSSGFMTTATMVAYRMVWGYRDTNNNLILGAPSQRVVISNSSGGSRDVIVNFSVPAAITTSYFYQVYRSGLSVSATTDPADDQQLVYESNPTSTDISNKFVQFTDSTPDSLRGAQLYTNSSQEGISQSNNIPPSAKDIAAFKNIMFYANTLHKQNKTITMLGAGGSSGVSYVSTTGTTTNGSAIVTALGTTTGLQAGQSVTGTGIPAGAKIQSVDTATQVTLTANATASNVGTTLVFFDVIVIDGLSYSASSAEDVATLKFKVSTGGTPAQNISDTAQSLVKMINRNTSNTTINAFYISGSGDLPGKIYLEAKSLGYSTFYVTASAHGTAWNPQLPTSGTTVASTKDEFKHYLYFSKQSQPEAVPLLNFLPIGAADEPILRIIPLRDSLIIMKSDGIYRLTGTSAASFDVNILDNTVKLLAPETAVKLNNEIYAFTNQLVTTITDTGVGVISRPIEDQLTPLIQYSNFMTSAFAVSYETAHQYHLWLPTNNTDAYSAHSFIYNTFTQSWFEWDRAATCGVVNPGDDKMYFCAGNSNYILQQRKTSTYLDFCDEEYSLNIVSVSGTSVVLSDVSNVAVGDALVQTNVPFSNVVSINTGTSTVVVDIARVYSAGAATVYKAIDSQVQWAPQYCKNPGVLKQIREVTILLKDRRFKNATFSYTSNIMKAVEEVDLTGFSSFLWGYFAWGSIPWGGINDVDRLRTWVPATMQRCSWLNITFLHQEALGGFGISGLVLVDNQSGERTGK